MAIDGLYGVILAGGASARFWPFNGDKNPKFMLSADGKKSLLREAWDRTCSLAGPDRVLVVTGANQADIVREELPELLEENLLVEPARRDTMAAAGWAMAEIASRNSEGLALLTPADSHYHPEEDFPRAVEQAIAGKALESGRLYSLGVKPTRPETGFGYIAASLDQGALAGAAERFVEKPDLERAQEYLADGGFYWNVGSFLWRVEDFLSEIKRQQAKAYDAIMAFAAMNPDNSGYCGGFESIHKTSIDYGVMEGAAKIGLIPLTSNFDDIGTWDALADRDAMSVAGRFDIESKNCFAQSKGQVAFVGVDDLMVVVEGDKVLVAKRGSGQEVKQVAQADAKASNG